jgi:signal transduction histidine kinase
MQQPKRPQRRRAAGGVGRRRNWPVLLLLAGLITFICGRASPVLSYPEFSLLDMWMRMRPAHAVSPQIVLLGIESADADLFRSQKERQHDDLCTCQLMRRDNLGHAIQLIKAAGARVVGIDVVFDIACPEHDGPLLAALQAPGETVIMSGTNPTPGRFNFVQMDELLALSHPVIASPVLYNPRGVVRAVRLIQRDRPNLQRVAPGTFSVRGNAPPPFALALYAAYRGCSQELPEDLGADRVRCADVTIPVWHSEQVFLLGPARTEEANQSSMHSMLINWAGRAGTYPVYSLTRVMAVSPEERRRLLAGKIVLVGAMSDRQCTPMSQRRPERRLAPPPGMLIVDQSAEENLTGLEVHANALDTVLQQHFIRTAPTGLMWALMLGLCVLVFALFDRMPGWRALGVVIAAVLGVFVLARFLMYCDLWLFSVTPAMAMGLSAVCGALVAFAQARDEAGHLARSLQARDSVTSALVHDLKQPLTAINALAQVLRNEGARGGGRLTPEVIEHIQKQVQTALGDIDELLSTDPQRRLHLSLKRFDLAALARDLAVPQSLRTGIHTVEVQAPEEGLMVTADARYLGRALSNLMDNAIKYWPEGGTVVVELKREPGQVTTRVIDHGLGIPREAQGRLFERFERAVPEELDIPGTGIGLFSVKRIIEAHGGTVELISAPGEGSIFTLNLPDEPAVGQPTEGLSDP